MRRGLGRGRAPAASNGKDEWDAGNLSRKVVNHSRASGVKHFRASRRSEAREVRTASEETEGRKSEGFERLYAAGALSSGG